MWEYAIILNNNDEKLLEYIYLAVKKGIEKFNGIVAQNKENDFTAILIGSPIEHKEKAQNFLCKVIIKAICSFYKLDFLKQNLISISRDEINKIAFLNALLNFDKETDAYIISKNLSFDDVLYLDSFYNFKLKKLRDKWSELISLANENKECFMSNDAFLDLLKFLVDNIDINEEEIDIVEGDDGYRIFIGNAEDSFEGLTMEALVSQVIELSPQKINLYLKEENIATNLLKNVYEKRVNFKFFENKNSPLVFKNV